MSTKSTPPNPFADFTKMFEQFKVPGLDLPKVFDQFKFPGLDMAPIVESRRKDMQALVEANKAAYATMQALAHKQTEILTQAMAGLQESAKIFAASGGKPDIAKQSALASSAYQKALADMTELAEIARKSQADVMAGITQRAMQSIEEMKTLMRPK